MALNRVSAFCLKIAGRMAINADSLKCRPNECYIRETSGMMAGEGENTDLIA